MARKATSKQVKDRFLPRLTMTLFGRPKLVFFTWLVILIFGVASYATLLRREGFPSVNIPIAVVNGAYIVNDVSKVDADVAKPVSDIALKQEGVSTVLTQSAGNFVNITVMYKEGTDGQTATQKLEESVNAANILPESVKLSYNVPYFGATGGSIEKIDAAVSFYQNPSTDDTAALAEKAKAAVGYLNEHKPGLVKEFFVIDPFKSATNPVTGQQEVVQETFDQFGVREGEDNKFYNSVVIGVTAIDDVDVIELDKQLNDVLGELNNQSDFANYDTKVVLASLQQLKIVSRSYNVCS